MKTKLFLITFLCLTHFLKAQIVTIPDYEFKQALLNYSPNIDTNNDNEIQVAEAILVTSLTITNHQYFMDPGFMDPITGDPIGGGEFFGISDFTGIEAFINLTYLNCNYNDLTSLDVSALTQLEYLDCSNNINYSGAINGGTGIATLNLPINTTLQTLTCNSNNLSGTLDISTYTSLNTINCSSNQITTLTLPTSASLENINCSSNQITTLTLPTVATLQSINCSSNQISALILTPFTTLTSLTINNNNISNIDITQNTLLETFNCSYNQIPTLDVSLNTSLKSINCNYNLLTDLDVSYQTNLNTIFCRYNQLSSLNLKNGNNTAITSNKFDARSNSNLQLICIDDINYASTNFVNKDASATFTNICSFIPANSNTITGRVSFDFNNDGCDVLDTPSINTKIKTTGTNTSNVTFTNSNGYFTFYPLETSMTTDILPNLPSFFSVTPTTQTSAFTGSGDTDIIDFCISANSAVNDVATYTYSFTQTRPGFDSTVRVFYENLGSTTLSGTITLNFNDLQEVYNNASTTPDSSTNNSLTWNYTNLLPFEKKYIDVHFTINTPTDPINPVNGGDTIVYTTSVTPTTGDININNNTHIFDDFVVNSYDPNDVLCFEGDKIKLSQVPDDLTHRIRFQNTGSASAINIVVKNTLDSDLDVDTFEPISASHDYRVVINNTNEVEFIFENINLADSTTSEPDSHGWIFYKIKPINTAVIGDAFDTTANIFFDYNFPITTNTYVTTVSTLTNIPDDNFEQVLIDLGYDNGTLDDVVFTSNIDVITSLDVSNKSIIDLTGIENFTALQTLNTSTNQLVSLDLSQNTNLTSLLANDNQLTDLNVKNTNNTNFTVFDTTNNPNLTCIEVDDASYADSNWTNIDNTSTFVNNQTACTTLHIDELNLFDSSVYPNPTKGNITINVKQNSDLTIYSLSGKKIKSIYLIKGENEITNLNLSLGMYLFELKNKNQSFIQKVIFN